MKTLADPRDKAEIHRRLATLRPDACRRWGRMSVHQVVCHLSDANRVALGSMTVSVNVRWWTRTLLKWVALRLPLRWPSGIPTGLELDQLRGRGTPPGDFAQDVAEVAASVEVIATPGAVVDGRLHPLFGPMSREEWLRWGYLHMDHHLRQFGV